MEVTHMVAIHDGHDHGEGEGDELCPRCRFIERLADYLNDAAEGDSQTWHDATGEIIEQMHSALWALHRLRAEATTDYLDNIDSTGEAARALATLAEVVVRLDKRLPD